MALHLDTHLMAEHPVATPVSVQPPHVDRSREFELLCLCAGVDLSPERSAAIEGCVVRGIDWATFLKLAEFHGLLPLAAHNLNRASGVPEDAVQALKSGFETNVRRSLWFAGELVRITLHFDARGIKVVPYKGPALAQAGYGDVALRNFSDLDFLIIPGDFERAKQALVELQYQPSGLLSPDLEAFWLRNGYERAFDGTAGRNLVELQWGLAPRFFAVDLGVRDLFQRSQRMPFGGHQIPSLSPEDQFLVLCIHAAKHLWMRLMWLCDIAEFVRKHPIVFDTVLSRARALGVSRFILVSLWLANRLLDCAIPPVAQNEINSDPEVKGLGEQFIARLGHSVTYDFESTDYFRWILKLRERRRDRFRIVWRLLWTPGAGDLAVFQLPRFLFPLYRGIRLLRLMRKLF